MKIILIGFMGSGKSTMGKRIANLLHLQFIDADKEIERLTEKSIPELFELIGEKGFRDLESHFIDNLKNENDFVLSTGGGMPCFNDNIEKLNQMGTTIYLKHSANELVKRLTNSKKTVRPLIQGKSAEELHEFITTLLQEREKEYLKATFITHRPTNKPLEILELIGMAKTTLPHDQDDSE